MRRRGCLCSEPPVADLVLGHTALGEGAVAHGRNSDGKGDTVAVAPAVVGTAATENSARGYMDAAAVFVKMVAYIEVGRYVA